MPANIPAHKSFAGMAAPARLSAAAHEKGLTRQGNLKLFGHDAERLSRRFGHKNRIL
ncbi:hypothetical protein NAV26_10535 [Pseudomonas stutzeri]|uniref:hypothetical protein n=1 Tax=Stutzerimonas stutzeri TaxID=316 RepID=UPI0015E1573E|nr:hypothetical protein [Stutzerimonas stutzeri]MCQ4325394.1 hypothetical protein [Stutzerimonas stutzeri]